MQSRGNLHSLPQFPALGWETPADSDTEQEKDEPDLTLDELTAMRNVDISTELNPRFVTLQGVSYLLERNNTKVYWVLCIQPKLFKIKYVL